MKKSQLIIGISAIILLSIVGIYFATATLLNPQNTRFAQPSFSSVTSNIKSLKSIALNNPVNLTKEISISNVIQNPIANTASEQIPPTTKSTTPLKFVNEASFEKKVNQKSSEPLFWNGDSQDPKDAVYIIGVPGIISYSKDDYATSANVITKAQVDSDNSSKDIDKINNQLAMDNFDDLILGKINDVESLQNLYRTGIGGYLMKFAKKDLSYFKINGLDTQRTFLTLEGQSHPLTPVVNIIGKREDNYVWIKKPVYTFATFPKYLADQFADNKNTEIDQMLKVYASNAESNAAIISTAVELTQIFAIQN